MKISSEPAATLAHEPSAFRSAAMFVLDSFRPKDVGDPIFTEPMHEAAADGELRARFEETQRFDALLVARFHDVPVPEETRSRILAGAFAPSSADARPAPQPS